MTGCSFCSGKKVVTNPAHQLQQCPLCNGTGQDTSGGIPFWYDLEVALNALQVLQNQIITVVNGDFVLLFLMATSTGTFKIQFSDKGKNRPFSDIRVDSRNSFGTAQNPFPILTPYTFNKGGVIGIDLEDTSNANNTVRVSFFGITLPS